MSCTGTCSDVLASVEGCEQQAVSAVASSFLRRHLLHPPSCWCPPASRVPGALAPSYHRKRPRFLLRAPADPGQRLVKWMRFVEIQAQRQGELADEILFNLETVVATVTRRMSSQRPKTSMIAAGCGQHEALNCRFYVQVSTAEGRRPTPRKRFPASTRTGCSLHLQT